MIRNLFRVIAQALGFLGKAPSYATQRLTASAGTQPRRARRYRKGKVTSSQRKKNDMLNVQRMAGIPERLRAWLAYENPRGRRTSRPGRLPYCEGTN